MKKEEMEKLLRMARAYAAEKLPWFAPALCSAQLVISEECQAPAAIDLWMRVYFNPSSVENVLKMAGSEEAAMPYLGFLWVHEISHYLRKHGERGSEIKADPKLWNYACDLEINDDEFDGLEPLREMIFPWDFGLPRGKIAEFYYSELLKLSQNKLRPIGNEGSGVHGQKCPWELPEDCKEVFSISRIEGEALRRAVAREILSRRPGDVPAGWVRWAKELLQPKVDWRELLKRRVRGAISVGNGRKIDYMFSRPHRRSTIYEPFLLPSLRGDVSPQIACVVDTSGSIDESGLSQMLAEVRKIFEDLMTPVTVIPCDAVPYEPIRVFSSSQVSKLKLKGGGGTDMVAGIDAALKAKPTPNAIVVLTDGYTPFPTHKYIVPVIFGILDPYGTGDVPKPPIPPWSEEDIVIIPVVKPHKEEYELPDLDEDEDDLFDDYGWWDWMW